MRTIALATLAGLVVARTAMAQPPGETAPEPENDKTVLAAYALSVAATTGPLTAGMLVAGDQGRGWRGAIGGSLGIAGAVVGPSAGHWYAGEGVTTGLVLRAGGAAAIAGLVLADARLDHASTILGLAGAAGLWGVGAVWDLGTLPRSVHRANARHVVPVFTGTGLAVAGTF